MIGGSSRGVELYHGSLRRIMTYDSYDAYSDDDDEGKDVVKPCKRSLMPTCCDFEIMRSLCDPGCCDSA